MNRSTFTLDPELDPLSDPTTTASRVDTKVLLTWSSKTTESNAKIMVIILRCTDARAFFLRCGYENSKHTTIEIVA